MVDRFAKDTFVIFKICNFSGSGTEIDSDDLFHIYTSQDPEAMPPDPIYLMDLVDYFFFRIVLSMIFLTTKERTMVTMIVGR